jgi:regulatory protein
VSGKANSSSSGSDTTGCKGPVDAAQASAGGDRGGRAWPRARREKRAPRPLDQAALHDLALSYVARFATTGAKLEGYLLRKLRERGIAENGEDGRAAPIDVPALVAQMIEAGYVDDDAFARMRSRDLTARGFGARRIEQALWAAGVDEPTRADHAPGEEERRQAAVRLAQKRRFGPFSRSEACSDRADEARAREKAIAAMLRAGHEFAHARFIVEATSLDCVEDWLAEAGSTDGDEEGINGPW